jgi:hypothetical protein
MNMHLEAGTESGSYTDKYEYGLLVAKGLCLVKDPYGTDPICTVEHHNRTTDFFQLTEKLKH